MRELPEAGAPGVSHVAIEFDRDSQPIRGRVVVDGAEGRAFQGYVQLIACLERARDLPPASTGATLAECEDRRQARL